MSFELFRHELRDVLPWHCADVLIGYAIVVLLSSNFLCSLVGYANVMIP